MILIEGAENSFSDAIKLNSGDSVITKDGIILKVINKASYINKNKIEIPIQTYELDSDCDDCGHKLQLVKIYYEIIDEDIFS